MRLIMALCEHIHVLDQGRTLAEGEPDAIRHDTDVRRAYLGSRREAPDASAATAGPP